MPTLDPIQTNLSRGAVYTHIGDRLRHHRQILRQSQTEIAQLIGVSPQQYQKERIIRIFILMTSPNKAV